MVDVSFGTIWERIAEALPDAVAIRAPERALSYRQFHIRAARLAAALRESGIEQGSKVACYLYNGPEYLETGFAAFKLGAVPVNVNYRYRGEELTDLLTDADAEALVYSGQLADPVQHAARHVPTLRLLVQTGPGPPAPAAPAGPAVAAYEALQARFPPLPPAPRPGTDQLFMYTGGTTGRPKGVIWALGDLMTGIAFATYTAAGRAVPSTLPEAVDTAVAMHAAGESRVSMPVVPLTHGTGLFNTFGTLLTAGEVVFTGDTSLDPDRVWQAVARHGVTNLVVAGNAVARPLVDALVAVEQAGQPYELSSLRTIISSGAAFTDDLKAELHRRTPVTILDGLAASEGGPFAFAVTSSERDLPSQLRPVPEAMVLDDEDHPLPPGSDQTGVLAFGGPLPLGYHKDPDRTAATYRTIQGRRCVVVGDCVRYLADGSLRFLGRGSGVINTGGEKVYPGEVEDALLAHPAVTDAAVVGEPDDTWGERVTAVVSVRAGGRPLGSKDLPGRADLPGPDGPPGHGDLPGPDDLLEWLRPRLAGYKLPRRLAIVAELPRTPSGKLELRRIRELLQSTEAPG